MGTVIIISELQSLGIVVISELQSLGIVTVIRINYGRYGLLQSLRMHSQKGNIFLTDI